MYKPSPVFMTILILIFGLLTWVWLTNPAEETFREALAADSELQSFAANLDPIITEQVEAHWNPDASGHLIKAFAMYGYVWIKTQLFADSPSVPVLTEIITISFRNRDLNGVGFPLEVFSRYYQKARQDDAALAAQFAAYRSITPSPEILRKALIARIRHATHPEWDVHAERGRGEARRFARYLEISAQVIEIHENTLFLRPFEPRRIANDEALSYCEYIIDFADRYKPVLQGSLVTNLYLYANLSARRCDPDAGASLAEIEAAMRVMRTYYDFGSDLNQYSDFEQMSDMLTKSFLKAGLLRQALVSSETAKERRYNAFPSSGNLAIQARLLATKQHQQMSARMLEEPLPEGVEIDSLIMGQSDSFKRQTANMPFNFGMDEAQLSQLQRSIGEGDVLLSYTSDIERVSVFILTADELHYRELGIPRKALEADVIALNMALSNPHNDFFLRPAQRLYKHLLDPLEGMLAGKRAVYISADDVTRNLPWQALHNGTNYVVEQFRLIELPSLRLVTSLGVKVSSQMARCGDGVHLCESAIDEAHRDSTLVIHDLGLCYPQNMETGLVNESGTLLSDARIRENKVKRVTAILGKCVDRKVQNDFYESTPLRRALHMGVASNVLMPRWIVNDSEFTAAWLAILETAVGDEASKLQSIQQQLLNDSVYNHPHYWASLGLSVTD